MVEKLKDIGNLDDSQCDKLFDKMDGMIPIDPKRRRRECVLKMKSIFYEKWITKCMYSVFDYFKC